MTLAKITPLRDGDVQALLTDTQGLPVNVAVVGAALVVPLMMRAGSTDAAKTPEMRHVRLAFMAWDRIRTGELRRWPCLLCAAERSELQGLSCLAVIDRVADKLQPSKPALVAMVCGACDSVSSDDTRRRIEASLGLRILQEGHA